jgi:uncharacterized UPF0146 family protein
MGVATTHALVGRLARFDRVVEVGVGRRPKVAAGLAARGVSVTATDIRERSVPGSVRFVRDDATDPDREVYAGADAVFARNLPPELHGSVRDVAREVGARFLFTTLGADPPAVPVARETLPVTTLFVAEPQPP